ncbi:hypothetical protein HDU98_011612, partial [Podochytrium sp. JEL0797]
MASKRLASPPLFSDSEDDDHSTAKRTRIVDDPMAGFMDDYEDLSPEEIDAKDAEYAALLSFVLGESHLSDLPVHLRFEAERRKKAWDAAHPSEEPVHSQPQSRPSGSQSGLSGSSSGPARPPASAVPTRFAAAFAQLQEMGLADNEAHCIRALTATNGNVEAAIEWMFTHEPQVKSSPPVRFPQPVSSSSSSSAPSHPQPNQIDEEQSLQEIIAQIEREEKRERDLRKQILLEQEESDARMARQMEQELVREEHDKALAAMKARQEPPLPVFSSQHLHHRHVDLSQPSSSSPSSSAIPAKPAQKIYEFDSDEDDALHAHLLSQPSSSSQQQPPPTSKFIPPPPILKPNGTPLPSTRYTPYEIPSSPDEYAAAPIYDMSSLLNRNNNYGFSGGSGGPSQPFVPKREFDANDDDNEPREQPLNEHETSAQLKDLLENVAITSAVPLPHERLASPPELKITLLEHQKIGVAWMLRMERGSNKGGILADDMGLGKTVQSLATCVLNQGGPTLVVAPTSLILQWKEEVREKVKAGIFKVFVYYGKDRKNKTAHSLRQYDIVITTYGTVAMEWPQVRKVTKKELADKNNERNPERLAELERAQAAKDDAYILAQRGELFKVHWHRVILDEAHTVKNKATRAARACVQLKAGLRWCLTGTPIQNNVGELYSLIDFLDIKPYCHWDKFRDEIEKPFKAGKHKRVMQRVQALLKAICLRRTKTSQLDGRPIITLEPKTVEMIQVAFSPAEREFYDSMEKKTLLKFNAYLKAGTVMQNYSNILVLLLRLRQACCHPSLVAEKFNEAPPELLEAAEASAVAAAGAQDPLTVLSQEIQQRLLSMRLKSGYECPICFDAIEGGKILAGCGHVFCGDCINGWGNGNGVEEKVCPQCRGEIHVESLVSVDEFLKCARRAGLMVKVVAGVDGEEDGLSEKAKGKLPKREGVVELDCDEEEEEVEDLDGMEGWIS